MPYSFNFHNLGSSFFFIKEARRKDIPTPESKFFISSQSTFFEFPGHNGSPRISNSWLIYWDSLWGEDMFLFAFFLLLIFISVLENNYNYFFPLFVRAWWEILPKILRFNMIIKKYNMVYSVNNVASIQVQLGLSVGEIYVVNILKVKKIPILKF